MFEDKNYIIFGCTSGIGLCTAKALAEKGANVFLVGRGREKLKNLSNLIGGQPYYDVDLSNCSEDEITTCTEECLNKMRWVDGMVYSAGVADILPIRNVTRDFTRKLFNVNLFGFISAVRGLYGIGNKGKNASVVGISSGAAIEPSLCQTVYAASKAGMNVAAKALAKELRPFGIRVNTVMPWVVDTKMIADSEKSGMMSESKLKAYHDRGGVLQPNDITDVIEFLLSDKSKAITGATLSASGGLDSFFE